MTFVSAALKYGLPSINRAITNILTNVTEQSKVTKKKICRRRLSAGKIAFAKVRGLT